MSPALRPSYLVLPAAILALLTGCTQFDLNKPIPWSSGSKDKPGNTEKVVAIWTDSVLYKPNRPPTRGFGGRLMFYGGKDQQPVKVDGTLVVYAFDETGQDPGKARPDRKYVFTPEQFAKHYSKSDIGHSYSVWIPWDQAGGMQQEISLIARFQPANGRPVIGEQTQHLLPGRPPEQAQLAQRVSYRTAGEGGVRSVSYEAAAHAGQGGPNLPWAHWADRNPPRRMSVTTIPIPPEFGRPRPVAATRPRATLRGVTPRREAAELVPPEQSSQPQAFRPASPQQQLGQPWPVTARQAPPRPATRFPPSRSRALGEPSARLSPGHRPWPPRPARWPFRPGSRPSPVRESESASFAPAAQPTPY